MSARQDDFSVLVLCLADPSGNPRPRRLIELCSAKDFRVEVASRPMKKAMPEISRHYPFRQPSLSIAARVFRKLLGAAACLCPSQRFFIFLNEQRSGISGVQSQIADRDFKIIFVEDLYLLPLAFAIKKSARVIFDAREYYPEEIGGNFLWRLTEKPGRLFLCRKYLRQCDAVMTVSPGLAARYDREFGLACQLVRSLPVYRDIKIGGHDPARIRMVHHGIANPDRMLESMIDIFSRLDSRFELDFYLQGNERYIKKLKLLAAPFPKIRFFPVVPFEQIVPMLNQYDVGLYFLHPTGFNTEYALPNKLFEFIQAGLLVAIGPSPDMAEIVRKYNCGIVAGDFDAQDMAERLMALDTRTITEAKEASHEAAKVLCFEREGEKIRQLVDLLRVGAPAA